MISSLKYCRHSFDTFDCQMHRRIYSVPAGVLFLLFVLLTGIFFNKSAFSKSIKKTSKVETFKIIDIDENPLTPKQIIAPSTDYDGSYVVSWIPFENNTYFIHELQERKNYGVWSEVFSGNGLSYNISSRNNGEYQYRVRTCSSSGHCSSFRSTQNPVIVSHSNEHLGDLHLRLSENTLNSLFETLTNARAINLGDDDPDIVRYYVVNTDSAKIDILPGGRFILDAKTSLQGEINLFVCKCEIEGNISVRLTGVFKVIEQDGGYNIALEVLDQDEDYDGDFSFVFNLIMILDGLLNMGLADIAVGEVKLAELDSDVFGGIVPEILSTDEEVVLNFNL